MAFPLLRVTLGSLLEAPRDVSGDLEEVNIENS